MSQAENKVRSDTAKLHYLMKMQQQIVALIETSNVTPEEVRDDLLTLNNQLEESKTILKKSLEDYFEYERANPDVPKNFLFKKLYRTFF